MLPGARITRVRDAQPDPSIAKAVGRHHTFETAIADLVDNSLDADATHILVRFLESDGSVHGLRVIDDGRGMGIAEIDDAMEYARKRDYGSSEQGHFGLGLKAASLSQTDTLNVYSHRHGTVPAGRTIEAAMPTRIGDLDDDDVAGMLTGLRVDFPMTSGTVVEWLGPRSFLTSTDARDRTRWLEGRINALKTHLGIVFHRHIAADRVAISIDVFDTDHGESGVPRRVVAIDPFRYSHLPADRFPAQMEIVIGEGTTSAATHVWPTAQAGLPEFRLYGRPGSLSQGFYFYRNDRLLQVGGWNTLAVEKPELEYVRIAVDIDETLRRHVTINPEKAGLELDDDLRQALLNATMDAGRTTFAQFLAEAESRRRESRRYVKRPVALVAPGRGLTPTMREAFEESVESVDVAPLSIRWRIDPSESPVRIDVDSRTIWLNSAYRMLLTGGNLDDNEDASLFKTLLVMIYSKYFEGSYLGSREKAELEAWDQLLTAAVRDESAREAKEIRDDEG